ncbi:MAG: ABC transporter ATP-binding protein/permease [Gemmataceae bacterium]|nr:ABC transporter ATP-binding protein/permease [Gemmataceae bacterium]MDW8266636.1 ABC transporter ATP-binding protein [Gemmataceae bacterium]
MQRDAFARARQFLNYRPFSKWAALVAAGAIALVHVALLVMLGLFADLMVNHGRVPGLEDLPTLEQDEFLRRWEGLAAESRREALAAIGSDSATTERLANHDDPRDLPGPDLTTIWRAYVAWNLAHRVGAEAAVAYLEKARAAESATPTPISLGVLSLVVRTQHHLSGHFHAWLARINPWMWHSSQPNLWFLTGLLAVGGGLALLRSLLLFLSNYAAARAVVEATIRMRRAIYHHSFRLGTLAFRALGPSEAASVFTRHVEAVHDALLTWLTVAFREPIKFGLVLAFALVLNFWLALAFLCFALLVWLVGGQVAAAIRRRSREATARAAGHLALLQESLMLMRLVKVYGMELFNQSRVERQLADYTRAHLRRYRGEAIYPPLLTFLGMIAAVILLYVLGLTVLKGRLSVPTGIVLVTALVSLYWPLESWLEHRRFLRRGRESAQILFQFLDRPADVGQVVGAQVLPRLSQALEFDRVSLREPGTGRLRLHDVSFKVLAGQRVAFVGADDMDKHALVYLIPRLLDPTSGEVRIDQHNLRWVTLDSLRSQIAMVMQHNLVFNDTVAHNIGCGNPGFSLPQIVEAAKIAHAHHFIQKLPRGYETPIGELGASLRLGEKFRIALARAILRDPAIFIIEEPAAGLLDDDNKAMIDDTLARVLPGRTVIFLPHRISTIRSCDRVFLLHKGRIEAAGEHRELVQHNELYQHLHYLEFNMFAGEV